MIKYCICYYGKHFLEYNADDREFVPDHGSLHASTWTDLEQAREALREVRSMFPLSARKIFIDAYASDM